MKQEKENETKRRWGNTRTWSEKRKRAKKRKWEKKRKWYKERNEEKIRLEKRMGQEKNMKRKSKITCVMIYGTINLSLMCQALLLHLNCLQGQEPFGNVVWYGK